MGTNVADFYQRYERCESGSALGQALEENQVRKGLWAQRISGHRGSAFLWGTLVAVPEISGFFLLGILSPSHFSAIEPTPSGQPDPALWGAPGFAGAARNLVLWG